MAGTGRVIAVLGYSPRRSDQLHLVCSARVERACAIAREGDVVVLSGWSRHPGVQPEAELMASAWNGPVVELVTETDARHTVGNAAVVAREARAAGAEELVLVTSWWHSRRATLLVRAALRGSGVRVTSVRAPSQPSFPLLVREAFFLA
ncbi:MAG TPA: YdcF family protein, partial [Gaiellaceae bacterium]